MKTDKLSRKPGAIAHKRWAAYAAAGAATALAGGNCAEAAVHYSGPLHVRLKGFHENAHTSFRFPLDQPGDSFAVGHYIDSDFNARAGIGFYAIASAAVRGYTLNSFYSYASKLAFGQMISAGPFVGNVGRILANCFTSLCPGKQWKSHGTGCVGFRFNNGAGVQYGWVRIKVDLSRGDAACFEMIDYAYADPGEPITAGQTSSDEQAPVEQSPDQGSLGWLALGAVGLLAWRKSRSRTGRYTRPPSPV